MRILICDDDTLIISQLNKFILEYFERNSLKVPAIAHFSSGEELLADTEEKDILFLDVEMPGLNGIYVGNELKQTHPNLIIIIVTSYIEYLDEAMRFHVFRYLSKPLDKKRLFRNIKDALKLYNDTNIKIPIETKDGIHTSYVSDIISIEEIFKDNKNIELSENNIEKYLNGVKISVKYGDGIYKIYFNILYFSKPEMRMH